MFSQVKQNQSNKKDCYMQNELQLATCDETGQTSSNVMMLHYVGTFLVPILTSTYFHVTQLLTSWICRFSVFPRQKKVASIRMHKLGCS